MPELFELVAADGYVAALDFSEWPKSHGEDDWRKLDDAQKAHWISVAQAMYRSVALAGGAKIKKT